MLASRARQRSEFDFISCAVQNLFRKEPVDPFAREREKRKLPTLNPKQSLNILAAAVIK